MFFVLFILKKNSLIQSNMLFFIFENKNYFPKFSL